MPSAITPTDTASVEPRGASVLSRNEAVPEYEALLRNEPMQARSTRRLTTLLDSAAAVVDEIGYERLTTAMVSQRAHSSIGTVYRYFPDRLTVLHALSARSLSRFAHEGVEQIAADENETWLDAMDKALDYWVDAYRHEPGFRSLRFGDVLDLRPRPSDRTNNGAVAETIASVLGKKYGLPSDHDLGFRVETALELCDALLARAFAFDENGDERIVTEALTVARNYLTGYYGNPRGS